MSPVGKVALVYFGIFFLKNIFITAWLFIIATLSYQIASYAPTRLLRFLVFGILFNLTALASIYIIVNARGGHENYGT